VDEASLRRPTLDDVFLQLTGHAAAAEAGTPEVQAPEVQAPEKAGVPA
jgi:ABC-2 type transport system ATP-binding protein